MDRLRLPRHATTAAGSNHQIQVPHALTWQESLPEIHGALGTVRQLQLNDAPALLTMLATPEVARFIPPPPTTIEGFERFIVWSAHEQTAGRSVCFAVVPHGLLSAVGLFQVRGFECGFGSAEWGFAIGSSFWGSGLFQDTARLVADFAFDVLGAHRLEARAAVPNGRGHGALRKLGAVREGLLRSSLLRCGQRLDQVLWTILEDDWRAAGNRPLPDIGASSANS